ncbi:hypothetical protein OC845_002960 [Tilletia horrida]|nr:hypothetical protein OC845_002960 [Tilletia horrida]
MSHLPGNASANDGYTKRPTDSIKQAQKEARHAHLPPVTKSGSASSSSTPPDPPTKEQNKLVKTLKRILGPVWTPTQAWIKRCSSWAQMKPILRSALLAWICYIFLLIDPVERMMGQASFLILIGALISPAELPLAMTIEREIFNLGLVALAWAWSCLGLKLANLARDHPLNRNEVDLSQVYQGAYLEARSSAVLAAFLALGSAFFLYIKVAIGPSPYLFGSIFAAILVTIAATTGVLFPFPLYTIGQAVMVPLAIKAGLAIFLSAVFFPKSVNSLHVERLVQLLGHVRGAVEQQQDLFKQHPDRPDYDFDAVHKQVAVAEAAIAPLQGASRLLQREVSFGLLSGEDLNTLQEAAVSLISPSDGWCFYYSMIRMDMKSEHFPGTPAPSRPISRVGTPMSSRPPSPDSPSGRSTSLHEERTTDNHTNDAGSRFSAVFRPHKQHILPLAHVAAGVRARRRKTASTVPVATFESLRFARVEAHLHTREADRHTVRVHQLLGEANGDLMQACGEALDEILSLLKTINSSRFTLFRLWLLRHFGGGEPKLPHSNSQATAEKGEPETVRKAIEFHREKVERVLKAFQQDSRHLVDRCFLGPGGEATTSADQAAVPSEPGLEERPHRYLYQAYIHQFHTIGFAKRLLGLLELLEKMDITERPARFWFPSLPHLMDMSLFGSSIGHPDEHADDEDTTKVEGTSDAHVYRGQQTKKRDPEALEPSNWLQKVGKRLDEIARIPFRGNILFSIKAGFLILLVSLPTYFKSSAAFAYKERAVWVLIMCQLTLMRWRGETIFGLFSRIVTTFAGCCVGLVLWYIGTGGSGIGNSYALAAVFGVAAVPLAAWRLQGPAPPISLIIMTVTVGLVLGYSIKDSRDPAASSVGWGWDVGWRRLVGVIIGVTAAGLWSLLPPSRTIRSYTRSLSATTIAKLGEIYTIVMTSAANPSKETLAEASKNLLATRAKLRRLATISGHASYEVGLRGPWPKEQYARLNVTQMEIAKLLSHLVLAIERLKQSKRPELMRKTRFLDTVFLGDCISIFYMTSSALRSAMPLPQLTAAPLVHRFLLLEGDLAGQESWRAEHRVHRPEDQDTFGFPKHFGRELLEDEVFMTLAVAMTTSFGILLRLDRLMVCTKELVGEAYPVGAGSYLYPPLAQAHLPEEDRLHM